MSLAEYKIDALKLAFGNTDIAAWYKTEHGVTLEDFDMSNVTLYGGPGMGDLSDMIIQDGVDCGAVSKNWDPEEIAETSEEMSTRFKKVSDARNKIWNQIKINDSGRENLKNWLNEKSYPNDIHNPRHVNFEQHFNRMISEAFIEAFNGESLTRGYDPFREGNKILDYVASRLRVELMSGHAISKKDEWYKFSENEVEIDLKTRPTIAVDPNDPAKPKAQ